MTTRVEVPLPDSDWLAYEFEKNRPRLRAVAFRMLGSAGDADDIVQEAWLRLHRSDFDTIDNLGGWLTTVVSRIALDQLRARQRDREVPTGTQPPQIAAGRDRSDPEEDALLADSVGAAMMMILDALQPAERLAFVLHDTFGVPFNVIGEILGRTSNAAKQLASRARRKVRGSDPEDLEPEIQREVVDAFLDAARNGNFNALIAILDPDVVLQADPVAVGMGSAEETRGATDVAAIFSGRAQGAETVFVDGSAGAAWIIADKTRVVWEFTIVAGRVVHIEMLADPTHLDELNLTRAIAN
jgi:RNA polymerase sigma-70 factor (ECF subfamily)